MHAGSQPTGGRGPLTLAGAAGAGARGAAGEVIMVPCSTLLQQRSCPSPRYAYAGVGRGSGRGAGAPPSSYAAGGANGDVS
jgi:hypothetical protein